MSETSPAPGILGGITRFELLRHLGSGGMGAVYEAFDKQAGARIALKTLRQPSAEALLHLKSEFRSVQDLRHPHLVDLFDLFEADGHWFFTMALVEGEDFLSYVRPGTAELTSSGVSETVLISRDRTRFDQQRSAAALQPPSAERPPTQNGELDESRLRTAFAQLALGLCALHDAGKAHRDIKPSNVLVTRAGQVVLVDFGLAVELSAVDARGQLPSGAAGTRAFMAPEQAAGRRVTSAADSFSAGVMLYLALTGVLPFPTADLASEGAGEAASPVLESNPDAPRDLSDLCHALLQVDPAARPTAREILRRLGHGAQVASALPGAQFVGRETEMAQLRDGWQGSRERAVTTLLHGGSGVGKSMLARRFATVVQTSTPDTVVLSGRCYERELVPYKAFDGVVDALSHYLMQLDTAQAARLITPDVAILARIFPVLRQVPAFAEEPLQTAEHPAEQRAEAFVALRKLLFAIGEARPLLVYIDDLQWADADSLLLLGELLKAGAAPRLFFVGTARSEPKAEFDAVTRALERSSDMRQIALSPLTEQDARSLASQLLGPQPDSCLRDAIVHEAAGHPLFLVSLAHYAGPGGALDLGRIKLDDVLWARIERMDAPARRVLEIIAVAGAPLCDATLASAAGLDPMTFAASERELCVRHLARRTSSGSTSQIEPYHDRIRETVLARLLPRELEARHASLVEALTATGEAAHDPQSIACHLEGAGQPLKAAEQAKFAAVHAAAVLAFDRAAELYQTALRLGAFEPAETQALTLELARSLTNAGRGPEAAEQYLRCVPGADPNQRLEYRRMAADHLLRSAHLERGTQVLSDVLAEIGESFPRASRFTMLSAVFHRFLIKLRGLGYKLQNEAQVSAERLMRLDVYHTVSAALSLIDTRRASVFQSRSLLLALRTGEPKRLAFALVMESVYVAAPGTAGLRRARALGAQADELATHTKDPTVPAACYLNRGFLEYHAGDFRLSARNFLEGERLYRNTTLGTYHEQSVCRTYRLLALRLTGEFVELWRGLSETARDAQRRSDRFLEAGLNLNVNQAWLARGQPDEALRRIEQSAWVPTDGGYHFQQWYEELARAELDLYRSDAASRLEKLRPVLPIVRRSYVYTVRLHRALLWHLHGRLLVASAPAAKDPKRALAEASQLATRLSEQDIGCAQAYGALLAAAVAHQRGEARVARRALERAVALADAAGLAQFAAAARFRLGERIGGLEGQALLGEARVWLRRQDIREPERMLDVWAPGFDVTWR